MQKLWIVGQFLGVGPGDQGTVWEFQGVFDSEQAAREACIGRNYFYGPATLNELIPADTRTWVGCRYPHGVFESREDFEAWKAANA